MSIFIAKDNIFLDYIVKSFAHIRHHIEFNMLIVIHRHVTFLLRKLIVRNLVF